VPSFREIGGLMIGGLYFAIETATMKDSKSPHQLMQIKKAALSKESSLERGYLFHLFKVEINTSI
jgi:hypothetical protein